MEREDLLWGAVGGLSFLVLVQGYELLASERVGVLVKVGVALVVAVSSAAVTGWFRERLRERLPANGRA